MKQFSQIISLFCPLRCFQKACFIFTVSRRTSFCSGITFQTAFSFTTRKFSEAKSNPNTKLSPVRRAPFPLQIRLFEKQKISTQGLFSKGYIMYIAHKDIRIPQTGSEKGQLCPTETEKNGCERVQSVAEH